MKFICVDITVLNQTRRLDSVSSIGILIGDTETPDTEFMELNILHDVYSVDSSMIETAVSQFNSILNANSNKCFLENIIPRINGYLNDNDISENSEFMVVTNNIGETFPILDELFKDYRIEYTNLKVGISGEKITTCFAQSDLFREFFRLFL